MLHNSVHCTLTLNGSTTSSGVTAELTVFAVAGRAGLTWRADPQTKRSARQQAHSVALSAVIVEFEIKSARTLGRTVGIVPKFSCCITSMACALSTSKPEVGSTIAVAARVR
jgi:hypothetical protein